ncbi:MAG: hypothetical protein Q4B80_03505 [Aerococcaceae bacterium]|nr:hypothetical protein [Aerococcaceae bacterium]
MKRYGWLYVLGLVGLFVFGMPVVAETLYHGKFVTQDTSVPIESFEFDGERLFVHLRDEEDLDAEMQERVSAVIDNLIMLHQTGWTKRIDLTGSSHTRELNQKLGLDYEQIIQSLEKEVTNDMTYGEFLEAIERKLPNIRYSRMDLDTLYSSPIKSLKIDEDAAPVFEITGAQYQQKDNGSLVIKYLGEVLFILEPTEDSTAFILQNSATYHQE